MSKTNNIELGESLFIPNEGQRFIVYGIKGNSVKLVNYQSKTKITMSRKDYAEIKEITETVDMDFAEPTDDYTELFFENTNFEEIDF
jgi:GTPase Era involved in 16S rRNA processing